VGPLGGDGCIEHATQGRTINTTSMKTETENSPSELIHDHQHPVALYVNGSTPKQADAPETVLRVAKEGQP
jgi:hypothetical protein